MLAHGGGKIINTASMASLIVPHPQKQAEPISANSCSNLGEFLYESRRIVCVQSCRTRRSRHESNVYLGEFSASSCVNLGEFSRSPRRILTFTSANLTFTSANSHVHLGEYSRRQAAYNASKSAVVKITQSLGCEWASRGVSVNCISPGVLSAVSDSQSLSVAGSVSWS